MSVEQVLVAARSTLLDGDGPLIKLHSVSQKWCCLLCKRQFATEKQLGQHLLASDLHKTSVHAAQASGRLPAPMPTAPPPAVSSVHDSQPTRKRCLEDDSRLSSSHQRLKQMEEFEQALAAKARASSAESGILGDDGRQPAYRDRAKERLHQAGGYGGLTAAKSEGSAREANRNTDWKCGHCTKLNFAREVVCCQCAREIDDIAEYMDASDFQRQRHQGMLKLAQRLEPGAGASDFRIGEGRRPLS